MPGATDFLTNDFAAPAPQTSLPTAQTQPSTPADTSLDFLTNDNPQSASPTATQEPDLGWSDVIGQGLKGAVRGAQQVGETLGAGEAGPAPEGAAPFSLSDVWHPGRAAAKFAERFGESFPTTAGGILGGASGTALTGGPWGGIVGGALGAGGMSMVQDLGKNLHAELRATPDDPDGAYDRAIKSTMASGAFSAAAWAAFPTKLLQGPIKNALFQTFGVQPGLAMGHQATENLIHGRDPTENLGQAYTEGAVGTAAPLAGGKAAKLITGFLGKGDQLAKGVAEKPPQERTAEDLHDIANAHYKDINSWGVKYTNPEELQTLHDSLEKLVTDAHGDERDQPTLYSAIDDITQPRRGRTTVGFEDIDHVRGRIAGLLSSPDGNTRRLAALAIHGYDGKGGLDAWVQDAAAQERAGVDPAVAERLADKVKIAREYWRAGEMMKDWDQRQAKIDYSDNPEKARRTAVQQIVNNPKTHWQYTEPIIDLLKQSLSQGQFARQLNRLTHWFSPHSSTAVAAEFLAHHFAGPIGAAVAPVVGEMVRRRANKPVESATEAVPGMIRQVPSDVPKPAPPLGVMGRTARDYNPYMGPAFVPQPQARGGAAHRAIKLVRQTGGDVFSPADPPIGDFDEALDPQADLLPNYPQTGPAPEDLSPAPIGEEGKENLKQVLQPSYGDFVEALNPQADLLPNFPGSAPYPEDFSPSPTPGANPFEAAPPPADVPLPQPSPLVPIAAPGQGKGTTPDAPMAMPGHGKGATPRHHVHRRRHYQGGGDIDDSDATEDQTPDLSGADQAQAARDAAAQTMRRAVGPSPTQPMDVPPAYQSWGNLAQDVASRYPNPPSDIRDVPDWIETHPQDIAGFAGMFVPAGKGLSATAEAGLRSGMSPEDVWDLTNAFKDTGGAWRTETLGPTKLKIDPNKEFYGKIGEAYDNPALYARMPEIADTPFSLREPLDPNTTVYGDYLSREGEHPPEIRARPIRDDEGPESLLETLAHETQHAVDQPSGLLRQVGGDPYWHSKGLKGNTSTPEWQNYVKELTPFFKNDPERAAVNAEMGTVPRDWERAARQATDFMRYKNSIHEVMARLTGRREDMYNILHAMQGPKQATAAMRNFYPFHSGSTGYDVPAELQLLGKKYPKKAHGGAAGRALAMARR